MLCVGNTTDHEYRNDLSAGESTRAMLCDDESVREREEVASEKNWASVQNDESGD